MPEEPPIPTGAAPLPPAMRQMEADIPFQRRVWTAERVAWVGLALLSLAGLLGVLGRGGPFSEAEVVTPDGALRIRYERFQRMLAPATFRIELGPRPPVGETVEVQFGADVLEGWRLVGLMPSPASSRGVPGGLAFSLPVSAGAGQVLAVETVAERAGIVQASIGTLSGPPARMRAMVWP